jgi:hypothetical protein
MGNVSSSCLQVVQPSRCQTQTTTKFDAFSAGNSTGNWLILIRRDLHTCAAQLYVDIPVSTHMRLHELIATTLKKKPEKVGMVTNIAQEVIERIDSYLYLLRWRISSAS